MTNATRTTSNVCRTVMRVETTTSNACGRAGIIIMGALVVATGPRENTTD